MAVTTTRRARPRLNAIVLGLAVAGLASAAHAADVTFSPRIELRHTYTDNLRLSPLGQEDADMYTQVRPGFDLRAHGRRVKANASYTASYVDYRDRATAHNVLHNFSGEAGAEVIEDWFYIEGKGSVDNQLVDPFGPFAIGQNVDNPAANRAEVRNWTGTAYVRHRYGNDINGEVRYTRDGFSSDNNSLSDTDTERKTVLFSSGPSFRKLGWGVLYNDETIDFASSGKVGITTYFGTLKYNITPTFAGIATFGHEKYGYLSLANRAEGNFWTLGFGWRPSPRTLLEFSGGRRFYGNTFSLNFTTRMRRAAWQVTYAEDITTTQQQFRIGRALNTAVFLDRLWAASIPDERARRDAVLAFMRDTGLPESITDGVNTFANRFFLQKALQASVAWRGQRTTAMLNAYDSLRRATSGLNIDPLFGGGSFTDTQDLRQVGLQGLVRYALRPETAVTASFGHANLRSHSVNQENVVRTRRIALSHSFSRRLRGEVELRRMHQASTVRESNIVENAVSGALMLSF